jgi:hypothetical protein
LRVIGRPDELRKQLFRLAFDLLAWRVVVAMFDRERLIAGTRA